MKSLPFWRVQPYLYLMMAEYPNRPTNGDGVAVTPADLSLLTAALPSALRERLASFRKTMLLGELDGVDTPPKLSGDSVYASEPPIDRDMPGSKQEQIRVVEQELSRPSSSPSSCSATPEPRYPGDHAGTITEAVNVSGVVWNRVSPGMYMPFFVRLRLRLRFQLLNFSFFLGFTLLQNATYEAQRPQPDNGLARSLFINGLLYLLEALPNDMSVEEASIIRSRLPNRMQQTMPICTQGYRGHIHVGGVHKNRERSLLHRVLAMGIIQIFVIVNFLVPYVKLLLRHLYKYERSYRVHRAIAINQHRYH